MTCGYGSSIGCYKGSCEDDVKFIFGSQHGTTDILCTDLMYSKSIYVLYALFYVR